MRYITTFFAILLTPLCLFADEPQWKHFVQEETLLIVHVDLNKIDIEQTLQNNASIAEAVLKAIPSGVQDTQSLVPIAEMGKAFLTETVGIQEAYLVVNLRMPQSGAVAIILPQNGKISVEALKNAAGPGLYAASSKDNRFVVLPVPLPGQSVGSGSIFTNLDEHIDLFIPPTPAERPDFAEAFAAVENAPIQIAAALPEFVRKVVRDTNPKLPEPFEKWDIVTPLSGLRWKAVGIEPAKPAIHVAAAMTSELTALNTLLGLREVLATYIKTGIEELEVLPDGFTIKSLLPALQNRSDWIHSLLIPKQEGNKLGWRWEKPQFDEILELAIPVMEEAAANAVERGRQQQCANQMKQLLLSFHNYADVSGNNQLPPPFTVDDDGKPLHSWRVLVLPFIDQVELYRSIRLDEPWDSEHNKQFHDKMPSVFRCPVSTLGNPNRDTVYCMVVGNETIGVPDGKGSTMYMITDGMSNTIALVERKTPVCWMEPVDVLQEHAYLGVNKHEFGIGSEHSGGVIVAIADGSVRFMKEGIPLDILKALLTKAGGESVPYNGAEVREFLELAR